MLDENEIVSILCSHLEGEGASILERRTTTETGIDVICRTRDGRTLHIEAKGGTSSRRGSPRYSKPFTRTQVFDRVAKGTYTAIAARNPGIPSCCVDRDRSLDRERRAQNRAEVAALVRAALAARAYGGETEQGARQEA